MNGRYSSGFMAAAMRRSSLAAEPGLEPLPGAAAAREGGPFCPFPRRTPWPRAAFPSAAEGGGGARLLSRHLYGDDDSRPWALAEGPPIAAAFEVTRAQWREFDPAFNVAPGEENLPVGGVTFERARRSGEPYRLPATAELKALTKRTKEGGITLDWWAGYTPNPEDREQLERAISNLPGDAPHLLGVGSPPAASWGRGSSRLRTLVSPAARSSPQFSTSA